MQEEQILLTKRWAMTKLTVEASKKAAAPISRSRGKALGASLVCKDERTKWPVKAECTAISTVSLSRISPTTEKDFSIFSLMTLLNSSPIFFVLLQAEF